MSTIIPPRQRTLLPDRFIPVALGLLAAAAMSGAVFAAWSANGPVLLNALTASGLAWCL